MGGLGGRGRYARRGGAVKRAWEGRFAREERCVGGECFVAWSASGGGAHEGVPRDGLIGFARAVRVFFDVMKKAARDGVWRGAGIAVLALCHCGRVCECVNLTCRRQFETRVTAQSLRSYRANFGQREAVRTSKRKSRNSRNRFANRLAT